MTPTTSRTTTPLALATVAMTALAGAPDASAQEVSNTNSGTRTSADARADRAMARVEEDARKAGENIDKTEKLDEKSKTQKVSRRELREQASELARSAESTKLNEGDDGAVGTLVNNDAVRGGGLDNVYEVKYETRTEDSKERKVPVGFSRRSDEDVATREERYGKGLVREMAALAKTAKANGGQLSDEQVRTFLTLADRADGDTPSYGKDQAIAARMAGLLGLTGKDGPVQVTKDGDVVTRLDITYPKPPPQVAMKTELPTPPKRRAADPDAKRPSNADGKRARVRVDRDRGSQNGRRINRTPGR